jgi:putative resolvase
MYNVEKYLINKGVNGIEGCKKICYCRLSSRKQREDLKNQIEVMKNKFPTYEIISDIGSGLNYNREGLKKIIDYAINGKLEILIIAYIDWLE